jgi:hypothetical protein
MALLSPGLSVLGLAEQAIVGGAKSCTVYDAVQSADCPAFDPSVTWPLTV